MCCVRSDPSFSWGSSWSGIWRLKVKHFRGWVGKAGGKTGEARGGPGGEAAVHLKACYPSPDLQILQENLGNLKT